MTMINQVSDDYYGVIYKGSLILPIVGLVLVIGIFWYVRKRRWKGKGSRL